VSALRSRSSGVRRDNPLCWPAEKGLSQTVTASERGHHDHVEEVHDRSDCCRHNQYFGNTQQATPPYGTPISLEQAKKVIAAGESEAQQNNLLVVITVVNTGGYVVATHRLDNTQLGSVPVAESKARSAVLFRRSSKAFEDAIANGELD
jgi:hypothetical protein